jgi:hypothetical protein
MGRKDEIENQQHEMATLPADLVKRFADMAFTLPETTGDGGASMIEQILGATDAADLDANWGTKDPDKLIGEPLTIHSATVSKSDFAEGLGVFLVVEATRENTHEKITFTTGSTMVVAQLVKAYNAGWLPMRAKLVRADRPSANGYYPQHLEVLDQRVPAGR